MLIYWYEDYIQPNYSYLDYGCEILGTIQKENGEVSTTIPDEVLEGLENEIPINKEFWHVNSFWLYIEVNGLTLQDGEKYVVLEIK